VLSEQSKRFSADFGDFGGSCRARPPVVDTLVARTTRAMAKF
jgi:hypothetical protein